MKLNTPITTIVTLAIALTLSLSAFGQIHTWLGGAGYWDDPAMWDNGVPVTGCEAVLASGDITITNASAALGQFLMSGGTLEFAGGTTAVVRATDITITGGIVRHAQHAARAKVDGEWLVEARVYFACSNFFLLSPGLIDVNQRGWGGQLTGNTTFGCGPGGASGLRGGGGYGGFGGNYNGVGGKPYGTATAPDLPGSGGSSAAAQDGFGGGLVRIAADDGAVVLSGTIRANGQNGSGGNIGGSGSGGGIWISCRTLAGTNGVVVANGGTTSGANGCGGGGRIAVAYDTVAQKALPLPDIRFSAAPGYLNSSYPGDLGTLWFPDNTLLTANLRHSGAVLIPAWNEWSVDTLALTNAWVRFPADGMRLNVTNDVIITGTQAGLELGGNYLEWQTMYRDSLYRVLVLRSMMANGPQLHVGGDLVLTNGGFVNLYAAPTNGVTPYGALLAVTGEVVVASTSRIYPYCDPTNGAAVKITANKVTVLNGGAIDANNAGFAAGSIGGAISYGPGGGKSRGGGANGGTGGNYANTAGRPWGNAAKPLVPGSGGGRLGNAVAAMGGGVIWLEARDKVTINGTLRANVGNSMNGSMGRSAGGSIYIACNTLAATNGVIQANGANGGSGLGSGGGGRIAIAYDTTAQATATPAHLSLSVRGGGSNYEGGLGTIHLPDTRLLRENLNVSGQVGPFSSWSVDNLLVKNQQARFTGEGFKLTVTNTLTVDSNGSLDLGGGAIFDNGSFWVDKGGQFVDFICHSTSTNALYVGGDLILTNSGTLSVFAGPTNATMAHGSVVEVVGTTHIYSGSWIKPISHPTNGGSPLFRVADLTIAASGGFDANQYGFAGGGGSRIAGYGYGGGSGTSTYSGGGGYGGRGGNATYGGAIYGVSNAPAFPGSGGGRGNAATYTATGGSGGGLIRIESSRYITLNGTMRANGRKSGTNNGSAGGAGGGIYLKARKLSGSGLLRANGGNGVSSGSGASGGGGRIAVATYSRSGFSGNWQVNAGTDGTYNGAEGTFMWVDLPPPGSIIILR